MLLKHEQDMPRSVLHALQAGQQDAGIPCHLPCPVHLGTPFREKMRAAPHNVRPSHTSTPEPALSSCMFYPIQVMLSFAQVLVRSLWSSFTQPFWSCSVGSASATWPPWSMPSADVLEWAPLGDWDRGLRCCRLLPLGRTCRQR